MPSTQQEENEKITNYLHPLKISNNNFPCFITLSQLQGYVKIIKSCHHFAECNTVAIFINNFLKWPMHFIT